MASNLAKECPETHIVSVADREADIYEIFVEAGANETSVDFVIRVKAFPRLKHSIGSDLTKSL